ncbi:hypothetical protein J2W22_000768 [Sphingomonas kyeonggiensis]|uniref:hypothetical protein n=1 Tax=Sphingomonas kyeonggiensis TaxID=1268553 RepID=UPI002783BD95|nr:hypothetical protein [Sphingomonas kyeonggiensis]MDQ0248721.1 hypothetical protein [Sphingomonas kyeonggiensis]
MRASIVASLLLVSIPASAQQAPPATAQAFLIRWNEVQSLGLSPVSPEMQALLAAFGEEAARYKETLAADAKAGKPPRACPRKGSSDTIDLGGLAASFEALPADARAGLTFHDGVYAFLDRRYPCAG